MNLDRFTHKISESYAEYMARKCNVHSVNILYADRVKLYAAQMGRKLPIGLSRSWVVIGTAVSMELKDYVETQNFLK